MKCIVCNRIGKYLLRTNPTDQEKAGWTCKECLAKIEPELTENLKEDGLLDIMDIIDDWANEI